MRSYQLYEQSMSPLPDYKSQLPQKLARIEYLRTMRDGHSASNDTVFFQLSIVHASLFDSLN